jgi:hypothetical protein
MAASANTVRTRRCLRAWLASDGWFFHLFRCGNDWMALSAPLHFLPIFVISFLRYDVIGTTIRQGISVL